MTARAASLEGGAGPVVYPATAGLASRTVRKLAHEALERASDLPEWQDPAFKAREGFAGWRQALEALHSPTTDADTLLNTPQRRRLALLRLRPRYHAAGPYDDHALR